MELIEGALKSAIYAKSSSSAPFVNLLSQIATANDEEQVLGLFSGLAQHGQLLSQNHKLFGEVCVCVVGQGM